MAERTWLIVAVIAGALVLAYLWVKQDTTAPPLQMPMSSGYIAVLQQARASNKPILLFFTSKNCAPCEKMKNTVFSHQDVQRTLQNYSFYMVDTDQEPLLGQKFGVRAIPVCIVLDTSEQIQRQKEGYMDVNELVSWLGGQIIKPAEPVPPVQPDPPEKKRPRRQPRRQNPSPSPG